MNLPEHITHYYSRSDRPFQNLSDLGPEALDGVLDRLRQRKLQNPAFRRVFGSAYMAFRARTEEKLRTLFKARGGRPERASPYYFILGTCPWFAGLYPDTGCVTLDCRSLPQGCASVTYPDSFISMGFGPDYGLPPQPVQPYHGKVFLLEELPELVSRYGLPDGRAGDEYQGYEARPFEKYIEVQLWADGPVADYLCR